MKHVEVSLMFGFFFLHFQTTSTCCVCNGYYAPSFGEPLCGTCHAFLFPVAAEEKRLTDLSDNDEDSGNDEPPYKENNVAAQDSQRNIAIVNGADDNDSEELDVIGPPLHEQAPIPNALIANASTSRGTDRIAIYENAFLGDRPDPQPPRNLRQYLNALTESAHENLQNSNQNVADNGVNNEAAAQIPKPGTISALPVEVLLVIFSYLDDISLCHVGEVCKQWKNILEIHTPQSLWQRYTRTRWPLYHQITNTTNWFKV